VDDFAREAALGRNTILRAEVAHDQTALTVANEKTGPLHLAASSGGDRDSVLGRLEPLHQIFDQSVP
jgi:hypothetical protein